LVSGRGCCSLGGVGHESVAAGGSADQWEGPLIGRGSLPPVPHRRGDGLWKAGRGRPGRAPVPEQAVPHLGAGWSWRKVACPGCSREYVEGEPIGRRERRCIACREPLFPEVAP
jgi:hypothetical protein